MFICYKCGYKNLSDNNKDCYCPICGDRVCKIINKTKSFLIVFESFLFLYHIGNLQLRQLQSI